MLTLQELQQTLRDALHDSGRATAAISRLVPYLCTAGSLSCEERLAIYRGDVVCSLKRILRETYPVCLRLVGETCFDQLSQSFIRQTPSTPANLGDYPKSFPNHLSGLELVANLPYLPDVAQLEWCWQQAFNAADEPGLNIAALNAVAPGQRPHIVFRLPVSASLMASPFPVNRIWETNQDAHAGDPMVSLREGGVELLVWRRGGRVRLETPDALSWRLLKAIKQGRRFANLCDANTGIDTVLPQCVRRGWIGSFELAEPSD